ncbi:MAG: aminodeoxychorismate synthase, component I [bacterium]
MNKKYLRGNQKLLPLYTKFKSRDCNPLDIYNKLRIKGTSVLLDSGNTSGNIAQWSFIGMHPFIIFRSKNNRNEIIYLDTEPGVNNPKVEIMRGEPLSILKGIFNRYKVKPDCKLPPFFGGLAGFISYDMVRYFERVPSSTIDDAKHYDCYFGFFKTAVAIDHRKKEIWVVTNIEHTEKAYKKGTKFLEGIKNRIKEGAYCLPCRQADSMSLQKKIKINSLRSDNTVSEYKRMVGRAKEYIKAGDIYQANLSQRFKAKIKSIDPASLYARLREINPSPFSSFFNFPDVKIVSSSPERLIKLSGDIVETRPIAGTRPRGKDKTGDKKMGKELILNEKERAEHIMLVDLERNDLGRVCRYGSVKVDELMVLEKYSHVIHIVSNVRGRLKDGRDAFDCIRACFPGGTITGVPKVRCMEIIDELEKHRRGPYTGSAGYICFNGDMDLNILIRTIVIKDKNLYFQVGAGIVADSAPQREYEETLHKAEAMMEALSIERGALCL